MPTIEDVARQAGVSIATGSHVINHIRPVSDEPGQRVQVAVGEQIRTEDGIARAVAIIEEIAARA